MSITKFLVIFSGVITVILIGSLGYIVVGLGDSECTWISSSIEISIGLNGALAVSRFRQWLRKVLLSFCGKLLDSRLKEPISNLGEDESRLFAEINTRIFKRFDYRMSRVARYADITGPLFAFVGVVVLLTGCANKYYWTLVFLFVPFIVFHVSSCVCFLCVRDHYYEISYDMGTYAKDEDQGERDNIESLKMLNQKIMQSAKVGNGVVSSSK